MGGPRVAAQYGGERIGEGAGWEGGWWGEGLDKELFLVRLHYAV